MTLTEFVQPTLVECLTTTCTFGLSMSKGAHDVFAMVVSFLFVTWEPKHITICLFEMNDMSGVAMVVKAQTNP